MKLCETETELVELVCRCAAIKFNKRCPAFNKQDIEKLKSKDELLSASNVEYILLRYHEEMYADWCKESTPDEDDVPIASDIVRLMLENSFFRKHGVYHFVKHGRG